MSFNQKIFDPLSYGFKWVDDWYEWDSRAGHAQAKLDRDAYAKEQKLLGKKVYKSTLSGQRRTLGGIGTPHPEVDFFVTCYVVES